MPGSPSTDPDATAATPRANGSPATRAAAPTKDAGNPPPSDRNSSDAAPPRAATAVAERSTVAPPPAGFTARRLHFLAGLGPTETAQISDDAGNVLFTYRGFASVLGIIAGLVAAIVLLAGTAAAAFLLVEKHSATAAGALVLSLFFALVVLMLIPPTNVTLFSGAGSALKIVQISRTTAPTTRWSIVSPEGKRLGRLQKGILARAGRNRWTIYDERGRRIGYAADESLGRAVLRKIAGKFDREYEADVHVVIGTERVATLHRRPDPNGFSDVLEIEKEATDPRIVVALATLILGGEP